MSKSFVRYKNVKTFFVGLLYSFVVWFLEGMILLIAFKTIGIDLPFWLTTFVVAVSVLFGVISFLPGGLGVNEAIVLIILTHYSLTPAEIMTGMLFGRLYGFWMYVILGSVILSISKYRF